MGREDCSPDEIDDEVSRALDRATESDKHRQRTVRGVDVRVLAEERSIADESRRYVRAARRREVLNLAVLWTFRMGAIAGFVALGLELWRMGK